MQTISINEKLTEERKAKIENDSGATVQINGDTATVDGTDNEIDRAIAEIKDVVGDVDHQANEEPLSLASYGIRKGDKFTTRKTTFDDYETYEVMSDEINDDLTVPCQIIAYSYLSEYQHTTAPNQLFRKSDVLQRDVKLDYLLTMRKMKQRRND